MDLKILICKHLCLPFLLGTVNECEFIAGVCANGKCMDTTVGFRCMCNDGYKLTMNGKKCEGNCAITEIFNV